MSDGEPNLKNEVFFRLRRSILEALYRRFQEYPYAMVELPEIEEKCNTDTKVLNWNIVYLEKCGYVELSRSHDCAPYIALSAAITAAGIDLIEDENRFKKRFSLENEEL
jgi:hypothetical protein